MNLNVPFSIVRAFISWVQEPNKLTKHSIRCWIDIKLNPNLKGLCDMTLGKFYLLTFEAQFSPPKMERKPSL